MRLCVLHDPTVFFDGHMVITRSPCAICVRHFDQTISRLDACNYRQTPRVVYVMLAITFSNLVPTLCLAAQITSSVYHTHASAKIVRPTTTPRASSIPNVPSSVARHDTAVTRVILHSLLVVPTVAKDTLHAQNAAGVVSPPQVMRCALCVRRTLLTLPPAL